MREERISLLYQALMTTRVNIISEESGQIVIVVSVTIRSHLKELAGLKAANISSLEDHERTSLENGEYSVFYGSLDGACLKNE